MNNVINNLNYDFNILLHQFENSLHDRLNNSDKRLAIAWINKLKSESSSIEEAYLRNDFLYYLVQSVEVGCLKPPFDQKPPNGRILSLKNVLPVNIKAKLENAPKPSQPRPEIFERSPDKGAFLAAQPVPRSGAFCYLAIVSKEKN
ncbi:uncharacterized protein LOC129910594 [Episyrphus balteatus]|uniref:uncharacterized protein LOC129910594 n=1 Tax=Episyrphus balteatus TaxID=286459 RepID=UPI002484FB51|nr:uncharacterized protein LOC129910594 [Episyrphus balteatus]